MRIIPYDKLLHFGAGVIAGAFALLVFRHGPAAPALALVAGLAKELSDWISNRNSPTPKHSVEFWDVLATALGGVAAMLVYGSL